MKKTLSDGSEFLKREEHGAGKCVPVEEYMKLAKECKERDYHIGLFHSKGKCLPISQLDALLKAYMNWKKWAGEYLIENNSTNWKMKCEAHNKFLDEMQKLEKLRGVRK